MSPDGTRLHQNTLLNQALELHGGALQHGSLLTFHPRRASPAVATVATLTMLAAAIALLVLASYPRNVAGEPLRLSLGLPLWLALGGGICWHSVRYRLVWAIAVPLVVARGKAAGGPIVAGAGCELERGVVVFSAG